MSGSGGAERAVEGARAARVREMLVRPVVPALVLAGIFDWLSGNPLHGLLLLSVGIVLTRDLLTGRDELVPNRHVEGIPPAPVLVVAGVAFAIVVGGFARFSWPASLTVAVVASAGVAIGWAGPLRAHADPPEIGRVGAIAWAGVFVSLGLWELQALLLQPTLTTDSDAHPTISVLSDPALATHIGRTIGLLLWLAIGWLVLQ